jgi:hypothetical protein
MNRRVVRAMLATLALAGAFAVGVPSAVAQLGPDLAVTIVADRTKAKPGSTDPRMRWLFPDVGRARPVGAGVA